ncbi:hypothetical protein PPACK8108_LOCUS17759 [Phakopsora pachyrhizi]|uniref:Uncharacterized protein n=1 Tax=Phakopsora pachyrhizi TaxID=170000 RepID=A0AAV0B9Q7_PHAPC|nr:hypothetical protein PPACK8108_LOCUS17759 [Phakopsora pachyrhizi]
MNFDLKHLLGADFKRFGRTATVLPSVDDLFAAGLDDLRPRKLSMPFGWSHDRINGEGVFVECNCKTCPLSWRGPMIDGSNQQTNGEPRRNAKVYLNSMCLHGLWIRQLSIFLQEKLTSIFLLALLAWSGRYK